MLEKMLKTGALAIALTLAATNSFAQGATPAPLSLRLSITVLIPRSALAVHNFSRYPRDVNLFQSS